MRFGTSYYPEFTRETDWRRDLRNMRDAKLSILRIGEFMWSAIEPREGVYDFAWLDRFVAMAHELAFQIIMGTPTATPPPWLTTQYPEILIERRDGTRHYPGGRRDVDVDSEICRFFSAQIATKLGERYGRHPAVIGWQIDNELLGPEGEPPESHSVATTFRFRQYLKDVHGDLATLNERWGTRFWSQEYSDWGEIPTPRNPRTTLGHVLDYSRYFSDSQKAFLKLQYDALRAVIEPRQWVSHNSTAVFGRGHDHADWASVLDATGWDAYPGAAGGLYPCASGALAHDLFRSAKHKPFWIFETAAINQQITAAYFAEMRARGAEAILLWHWREHRANAEYESNAFCDWAGRPDPKRVEFMKRIAARPELQAPLPAKIAPRKAALLYCRDCERIYLTADPYMRQGLDRNVHYSRIVIETYKVLWQRGVAVDVVHPGQPLDGYDLLVAPSARVLSREAAAAVRSFVERGGVLLSVAKMAHLDPWASFYPNPGEPLEDVLGCTLARNVTLTDNEDHAPRIRLKDGTTLACLPHVDRVTVTTGEVLATFDSGTVEGAPAAVRNKVGRGTSFFAAGCSPELIDHLLRLAAPLAKLELSPSQEMVSVMPDLEGMGTWVFNHSAQPARHGDRTIGPGDFAHVPK
jgi:beta-galactosidase